MLSLRLFLYNTISQNKQLGILLFILSDWFVNFFKISRLEDKNSDLSVIYTYKEKSILSNNFYFQSFDMLYLYFLSFSTNLNLTNVFAMNIKTKQLNNTGFYLFNNVFNIFSLNQLYLYGVRSI